MASQERWRRRQRHIVVFLDTNISLGAALRLFHLRHHAHWISFRSLGHTFPPKHKDRPVFSPRDRRAIKRFFDLLGDHNVFEGNGTPPHHMKDRALLSYMARLMQERFPGRRLYLFYTHDKRFLAQPIIQDHPDLHYFKEGALVYIPLNSPPRDTSRITAEAIARDFERWLAVLRGESAPSVV